MNAITALAMSAPNTTVRVTRPASWAVVRDSPPPAGNGARAPVLALLLLLLLC
jgi:hypothetical protein